MLSAFVFPRHCSKNNNQADSDQTKKPAKPLRVVRNQTIKYLKIFLLLPFFSSRGELQSILEDIGIGLTRVASKTRPTECLF